MTPPPAPVECLPMFEVTWVNMTGLFVVGLFMAGLGLHAKHDERRAAARRDNDQRNDDADGSSHVASWWADEGQAILRTALERTPLSETQQDNLLLDVERRLMDQ